MAERLTVEIRLARWRVWAARLVILAARVSEATLPGSVDADTLADRLAAFVVRGIRLRHR
ncbi:hypothetical protein LCM17_12945 [Cereibacter sphaeroides]|nr:hypothetical protein [Cereibacter sphaeroides]